MSRSRNIISTHLNRISGEHKIITDETRICLPFYKYCSSIIHNKEDPQADVNITVYDIIKVLDMKIQECHTAPAETKSTYDLLELASTSCSKNLAIHLANDQAVLLSTVHNDFIHEVECTSIQWKHEICKDSIPGWRWLLSRLNLNFSGLLEVQCKHNRYGSVLFIKN